MNEKRYQRIASALVAKRNCEKTGNTEWYEKWTEMITEEMESSPSGSGFDSGTQFNEEKSSAIKLVFETSFHHMDEGGCYDGWTDHTITITPAFDGFDMAISGRDRNDIKEYISQVFGEWLDESAE
jgi:hypothetical protein